MGIHESKFSSSSSSASSSFKSSVFSSRDQRRRSRRNYTLITSSSNNNNNNRNVGVSVAAEATNGGENKEDLAVCLASISLMALTGEDAHLPKPGSSSSSSFSPPVTSSSSAAIDRSSFRNPFGRKKSSASWSRSSSTSAAPAAPVSSSSVESVSAAPSIKTVKTKLCEKLKRHKQQQQQQLPHHRSDGRHQLMEDDRFLAEHFNAHIQLLDCLEHEQEDDSSDWATMRSWLVWCLQNKLGDIESTSNTEASEEEEEEEERDPSVASSSFRITSNPCGSTSRRTPRGGVGHHHQLRRQLALDERSRSVSSSRGLRRQETSFDGAAVCSPQSSFESYGSTGTGGGT